ncbi:hypothetical protein PR003_g444 [Phytophthora rubi]|uniref:RxLR effector protein n=1 Tax=Phytophthora rubi TaxID=129364 RepID=A0A6A4G912_9STRA|nr:hypothetical protein PR001_g2825 [Phytophthora rubi]KAE9360020.1 hypothetical protein PR003_g444 [Phytophthora rubi]
MPRTLIKTIFFIKFWCYCCTAKCVSKSKHKVANTLVGSNRHFLLHVTGLHQNKVE